jgi:hypothetical protein
MGSATSQPFSVLPDSYYETYLQKDMGKKSQQQSADEVDEIEVEPGVGGYSVAIYKGEKLKGAAPLNDESYIYLKSKYKKHSGGSTGFSAKKLLSAHKGITKHHKKSTISTSSSAAAPVKEKKPLTETQRENLRRGREARSKKLAELKAQKIAEAGGASSSS